MYNSDAVDLFSYFCGNETADLPALSNYHPVRFTNVIPVTNSAGQSIGSTSTTVTTAYSNAGTYESVFPELAATSSTGTPTTNVPATHVSDTAASIAELHSTLRKAYIGMGVLCLLLIISLGVIACFTYRLHGTSKDFKSLADTSTTVNWQADPGVGRENSAVLELHGSE